MARLPWLFELVFEAVGKIPLQHIQDNLWQFSFFFLKMVHRVYSFRLNEAILMRTHNIPLLIENQKHIPIMLPDPEL